jgi:hypothetical protein
MAVDPLLPPDDPTPDPPAPAPIPASTRLVTCEFCGCRLTPRGEIVARGDVARAHLDLEDALRKAAVTLEAKDRELADARAEIAALKEPKPRRSIFS